MFPFRKILLPIDYSAPCESVMPYAREMAARFSADLTLVHAYGFEALGYSQLPAADPERMAEIHACEEERLQRFARETFPDQRVDCFAVWGEAGCVIHGIVDHQGTDLIMLATHGRGPIRRLLLGSVTTKVLHDVSAAVWTGTGAAFTEHGGKVAYRSLLCAVHESEDTMEVLKAAAAFAHAWQAQLHLVQVIEPPPGAIDIDWSPYMQDMKAAADVRLRAWKNRLNIDAPHTVLDGEAATAIREEAIRCNADLIVTGRGLAQSTLGRAWSRLYPIVRESPCAVLSI